MTVRYTHLELNRDVVAPAGFYTPVKEARLEVDGREALYIVSQAVIVSSCCGAADFVTALVPGYIVKWRAHRSGNGAPVSEVEPIGDEGVREMVRQAIHEREGVNQVEFW
jgi:hypothetical protein